MKDRDEVFPAHGTANEPTRLKFDHSCLCDAKVNLLKMKRNLLYIRNQFIPRSKHFTSRL